VREIHSAWWPAPRALVNATGKASLLKKPATGEAKYFYDSGMGIYDPGPLVRSSCLRALSQTFKAAYAEVTFRKALVFSIVFLQ
jgi:hypothetical protein